MGETGAGQSVEKFSFELFPDHSMTVCLFEDVTNAAEIRKEILAQKFDAAFLDATMIADTFQLRAAANKAVYALAKDSLTTHGLHTELIFCLSGNRSISAALNTFGIKDNSQSVVVAVINADAAQLETALSALQGRRSDLSRLQDICDAEKFKKTYKISDAELSHPGASLADSAVCRIAIRDSV